MYDELCSVYIKLVTHNGYAICIYIYINVLNKYLKSLKISLLEFFGLQHRSHVSVASATITFVRRVGFRRL